MKHRIRITSIPREPIELDLLAQVLIDLVLHEREQERIEAKRAATTQKENTNGSA